MKHWRSWAYWFWVIVFCTVVSMTVHLSDWRSWALIVTAGLATGSAVSTAKAQHNKRTAGPITVYIAGPMSQGDMKANVENAIAVADQVMNLGFAYYLPHLSFYVHSLFPQQYERWMWLDFHWLRKCDVLLRLPGQSSGADREVKEAKRLRIPVVYSIEELQEWAEERRAKTS